MCGIILHYPQMAVNIKDLYRNSGNRFKIILTGIFNKKNILPYLLNLFLLAVSYFPCP